MNLAPTQDLTADFQSQVGRGRTEPQGLPRTIAPGSTGRGAQAASDALLKPTTRPARCLGGLGQAELRGSAGPQQLLQG